MTDEIEKLAWEIVEAFVEPTLDEKLLQLRKEIERMTGGLQDRLDQVSHAGRVIGGERGEHYDGAYWGPRYPGGLDPSRVKQYITSRSDAGDSAGEPTVSLQRWGSEAGCIVLGSESGVAYGVDPAFEIGRDEEVAPGRKDEGV